MMTPENSSPSTQERPIEQHVKHLDGEPLSVAEIIANGDPAELKKLDEKYTVNSTPEALEKNPTQEQQKAFDSGKEMVLKLQTEGNDKSPEYWALYSHLTEGLGNDINWRDASYVSVEKINEMLSAKFPEKDQIVTRVCLNCGREYIGASSGYCASCGGELRLKQTDSESGMENRVVKKSELLNEREASKQFLSVERKKLAEEIREERKLQSDRLAVMKINIESSKESIDGEDKQYAVIAEMQGNEASSIAGRVFSSNLNAEDVNEERENITQLITNSDSVSLLKKKLEQHYQKADDVAKEKFEKIQKSVEHTALRNGVFFVHTIQERETLRHNELSNISKEATYEDDADILLSLEPTISVSSVFSGRSEDGKVSGLWSDTGGFLVGGGDIRYASRNDLDSKSVGIKERITTKGSEKQSVADIDRAVSKRGENEIMRTSEGRQETGTVYNEFIIDNPKIFGYFQPVGFMEDKDFADGKFWAGDMSTRDSYNEVTSIKNKLDKIQADPAYYTSNPPTQELYQKKLKELEQKITTYKERFAQMAARGNPLYIMTPDRKVYEYLGVNDDGSVNIGEQIKPEDVATGNVGLSLEKRKELGEKILEKRVFKQEKTIEEAHEIISNL